MKARYRNYALWVSLIAQGALLVQLFALLLGAPIADDVVEGWVGVGNLILSILATLGIISNPTKPDSKGFNL